MISEGQRNDINYAIPVLEQINIEGSLVMADRGYDSYNLIDYIYENGASLLFHLKRVPNSNAIATGGSIRKGIWSRNISSN